MTVSLRALRLRASDLARSRAFQVAVVANSFTVREVDFNDSATFLFSSTMRSVALRAGTTLGCGLNTHLHGDCALQIPPLLASPPARRPVGCRRAV